jgi:phosphate transport system permease protein
MNSAAPLAARRRQRNAAERRFRLAALAAVCLSLGFVVFLLGTMAVEGARGFVETRVTLPLDLRNARLTATDGEARFGAAVDTAATRAFGRDGPAYLADGSWMHLRDAVRQDPALLTCPSSIELPASSAIDVAAKHDGTPAAEAAVTRLTAAGALSRGIDWAFLTGADATDPVRAGIWSALKGSLLTLAVTLLLAFPIGVLAALYLEEYAPRNRWTDFIEVSINNLAAVPSIIFGLLGLAVFLGTFHLPRSAPLVGGLTLALMTMPVIVIAGRNAIRAVPPSIRDAALAVGATPVQVMFDHVLPLAMPGILTGTILGLARALGETAPLLMIGMRAFIAAPPRGFTDPATVLPVQIFLWSDQVDRGFVEKTSAAIIVLLVLLLSISGIAIWLRQRFEARR